MKHDEKKPNGMKAVVNRVDPGRQFSMVSVATEMLGNSSPDQKAVLSLLALSHQTGLPAPELLSNFAKETKGKFRWEASELGRLIESGLSPVEAISDERLVKLITPSSLLALRLAEDEGSLPLLYQAIGESNQLVSVADDNDEVLNRIGSLLQRWLLALIILSFIMLRIVPEFQKMLEEFGGEMPPLMKNLCQFVSIAVQFWFVGFIIFVPFMIWVGRWYWRRFWPSTWQNRVVPKSSKKRTALSMAIQALPSVSAMLATLKKFRPMKKYAKKFEAAHIRVGQGEEGWASMAKEKLISKRESEILAMSPSVETQGWLLNWFAKSGIDRRDTRLGFFTNTLIIIGNIALAAVVLVVGLSVFNTLFEIMRSVG